MTRRAVLLALLLPLLLTSACVYQTTSRGRGLEGSIAIPFLNNRTSQPALEIAATQILSAALERDGSLRVLSEDIADFLMEGAVTRYTEAPFSISPSGRSEEYKLTITVVLSFTDLRTGEDRFRDQSFTGSDNFFLEGSSAGEDLTRERAEGMAFEQIVESVLNTIFGEW
jgi:hypothetical protein